MTYKIADGHDVVEGSLTTVTPQPKSIGIAYTQRDYCGAGISQQGAYTIWRYNVLTAEEYDDLLTAFGLASALTNEVTVMTIDDTRTFVRKNGTIVRPQPEVDLRMGMPFYNDVAFYITDLEDAA